MARIIACTSCGATLNLPPGAEGRRLKCPRCGAKFLADAGPPGASPDPSRGETDSTLELSKRISSTDLPVIPMAAGDLRETFELPMLTESAGKAGSAAGAAGAKGTSDAATLFDDRPAAPRRKTGAEARAQSRRCPTCGSVVPAGMSLCGTCGLDLETGSRVSLEDEFAPPPKPRHKPVPIPIAVLGGLCVIGSLALSLVAAAQWRRGTTGAEYFIPVALFGTFAAVQFLRGKTARLLMVALGIGAAVDLVALIALPVYTANADVSVVRRPDAVDDPDAADAIIVGKPIDRDRLSLGITLLFLYAVVSVYLLSPQVHRHFRR